MDRKALLLKRLQICEFVLTEVSMFLDTHPTDKEALAYYDKYSKKQQETLIEYTEEFGSVYHTKLKDPEVWDWVENPWPWEMED